jgi:hypothetical protein
MLNAWDVQSLQPTAPPPPPAGGDGQQLMNGCVVRAVMNI